MRDSTLAFDLELHLNDDITTTMHFGNIQKITVSRICGENEYLEMPNKEYVRSA